MNEWLITNKELISIYSSVFQTIGAIAVPIALACWGVNSEKHKTAREQARIERDKAEQRRKEDKEYISTYIKENLIPFTEDKYKFKAKDGTKEYEEEIKGIVANCSTNLIYLQFAIQHLSYLYMDEYFSILDRFIDEILKRDISEKELKEFFRTFSIVIRAIPIFLHMGMPRYQKEIIDMMNLFVKYKGKIRDITLEVLSEPKYKRYYDSALEEIKKQDKNQYFKINKKAHH